MILQEPVMTEIFNNVIIQYGAVGALLVGAGWIVKYLVSFNLNQLKASIEENKALAKETRDESKLLEVEYKMYLKETNELLFTILSKNTEAFNKNAEAFQRSIASNEKLSSLMDVYMRRIKHIECQ